MGGPWGPAGARAGPRSETSSPAAANTDFACPSALRFSTVQAVARVDVLEDDRVGPLRLEDDVAAVEPDAELAEPISVPCRHAVGTRVTVVHKGYGVLNLVEVKLFQLDVPTPPAPPRGGPRPACAR